MVRDKGSAPSKATARETLALSNPCWRRGCTHRRSGHLDKKAAMATGLRPVGCRLCHCPGFVEEPNG